MPSLSLYFIYYFFLIFKIYLFILFWAVLGLHCCARAFSSCGEWGPLFIAVRGLLTVVSSLVAEHRLQVHGLQQLWLAGSRAQAQQLWSLGSATPPHVGSSQTRDQTRVPCIGRQIPIHCATREALFLYFKRINSTKVLFQFFVQKVFWISVIL